MTQLEEKYVRKVLRKLRLKFSQKEFEYFDPTSGRALKFDWDGAGTFADGSIALIEVELGEILDWHIQTHLSRLAVMVANDTLVKKLVWVINRGTLQTLKNIVDVWLTFFSPICKVKLPNIEYRATSGELLSPVQDRRSSTE